MPPLALVGSRNLATGPGEPLLAVGVQSVRGANGIQIDEALVELVMRDVRHIADIHHKAHAQIVLDIELQS